MRDQYTNSRPPKIPLTPLYERVNRHGDRYLVGRLGVIKLIVVPTDQTSKGERIWQAFVGQGPHATEEQTALAALVEEAAP